ncbi:MAG TPA: ECF transporter S component [Haloplasmataceae bacterium]
MNTNKITYSGFLIALGVLLPIIFHFIPGNIGPILLPIHYASFLAGGFFGPYIGMLVGLLTPIISIFLTGMPNFPVIIYITFETIMYGLIFGYIYYKKHLNIYLALITAMLIGRIVNILGNYLVSEIIFYDIAKPFIFINILNNLTLGLIGAIMQIIIIPLVINRVNISLANINIFKKEK